MVERCRVTVVVGLALVVENGSVGGYSWHIGAAREAFDLSLSLSLSLFHLLCIVLSATRHLSSFHLSVPPFSPTLALGSLFLSYNFLPPPSPHPFRVSPRDSM